MWQLLAKPLLGVVADGVKGFVETKKAKAELKVTEVKAVLFFRSKTVLMAVDPLELFAKIHPL